MWRLALIAFVFGLALINAAGVYAQLVAAHIGERGAVQSDLEAKDAAIAAKIEVETNKIADLDRQMAQIDNAVAAATQRGRTNAALSAMEGQRKARAAFVDERNREAGTLAALKAERAALGAKGRQIETESAPIRYVAELLGLDTDSEKAIRLDVLRSAGNRINCGCFSKAMIPAFCPLPTRGREAGRDRPAVRLHRRFRRGHHGCEGNGKGDDGLAPGGRQRNHDADRGAFPG